MRLKTERMTLSVRNPDDLPDGYPGEVQYLEICPFVGPPTADFRNRSRRCDGSAWVYPVADPD